MFNNFTEDYKKILLAAEETVKASGFTEILPEDAFYQIFRVKSGPIFEIFSSYGINEKIATDVLARKEYRLTDETRKGAYTGISKKLKDLILDSVKVAASFQKTKAGIEDFLLASLRESESWILHFFDFLGINPKDFEQNLSSLTKGMAGSQGGNFDPLESIVQALEAGLVQPQGFDGGDMEGSPFAINQKMGKNGKKEESQTPALDFFGIDLTAEAKAGKIGIIIGRDKEIERLISILNRKTKNNPCLVGEPGVGKTAIAEGLAKRIAEGQVPFAMQNKRVIMLDMSGLVAGTKYRGEFEARIKQIIDEASKLDNEIVLFIDEIHTIIGAGGGEGSLDAANILKPAMGRGKICVIGATTLNEYQKHIEKDSALERRFQKIEVEEPTPEVACQVIGGLKPYFEEYHNLVIDEAAIDAAVKFSVRYMTDRFLPDKAIDLIDEACSAKSMKYNFDEEEIKKLRLEIEKLQKQIDDFVMSQQYHKAMISKEKQKELETKIRERKQKKVVPLAKRLHINSEDIERIVNQITGIPNQNLHMEDLKKLKDLDKRLKSRIVGQNEAIDAIVSSIKRSRTGIADKNRPIGSFLFLGPTGVGKTELVKVLAEEFFGDPKAMIRIDMSEYAEKASASKLIGAAPGYVGYEEGGMLTEKVRRKPYSIVLFDELEKGNFEIFNLLLQILEDGSLTDAKGRKVNFRNTIIIMTSNIGSEEFTSKATQIGFNVDDEKEAKIVRDYDKIKEKITGNLDEYFLPEFVNRIDKTLVFNPLGREVLKKIVIIQLDALVKRLVEKDIKFEYDTKALNFITKATYNPQYGARPVRRYVQEKVEDEIANLLLSGKIHGTISMTAEKNELKFKTAKNK